MSSYTLKDNVPTRYNIVDIPCGKTCKIKLATKGPFLMLIGIQGSVGSLFGIYLVNGYGEGGTSRYHVSNINTSGVSGDVECKIGDAGTFSILVKNNDNASRSASMVITEFFNINSFITQII